MASANESEGRWNCPACTYLNGQGSALCEMCGSIRPGTQTIGNMPVADFVRLLGSNPSLSQLPQEFVSWVENQRRNDSSEHVAEDTELSKKRRVLAKLKETCLDKQDIDDGNGECSICFETQHVGDLAIRLDCGHAFHKSCVWPWLEKNFSCPACRYDLAGNTETSHEASQRAAHALRKKEQREAHDRELEERRRNLFGGDQTKASPSSSSEKSTPATSKNQTHDADAVKQEPATEPKTESSSANSHHRDVAIRIGLTESDMSSSIDLEQLVTDASNPNILSSLPVRELKRRLQHLETTYAGVSEKKELVDLLVSATKATMEAIS